MLGQQSVTLVTVSEGAKDAWGIPAPVLTQTTIGGCHFRPLSAEETVALTDSAVEMWRLTADPSTTLLAATAADRIVYNNITYEIVGGVKPHNDFSASVHHVTVDCQRRQTATA